MSEKLTVQMSQALRKNPILTRDNSGKVYVLVGVSDLYGDRVLEYRFKGLTTEGILHYSDHHLLENMASTNLSQLTSDEAHALALYEQRQSQLEATSQSPPLCTTSKSQIAPTTEELARHSSCTGGMIILHKPETHNNPLTPQIGQHGPSSRAIHSRHHEYPEHEFP